LEIRLAAPLAAPFADNLMNSVLIAESSVFKILFFTKKIQKYEILPCKKPLFSLNVQNEEIPYKNSGFGNFFVRNSLFLEFLHQTNLKVTRAMSRA